MKKLIFASFIAVGLVCSSVTISFASELDKKYAAFETSSRKVVELTRKFIKELPSGKELVRDYSVKDLAEMVILLKGLLNEYNDYMETALGIMELQQLVIKTNNK